MCQADARSAFSVDGPGVRKVTLSAICLRQTIFMEKGDKKNGRQGMETNAQR